MMAKLMIRKTRNLWQLSQILFFFVLPFQLVIGTKLPIEFDSMSSKEGNEKNMKASPMEILNKGRIVGGSDAQLGSYPFFVLLEGAMTGLLCGGSLVAPDVVLTAGHCDPYGQSDFYVYVNAYAMSENAFPNKEFQTMSTEKRKRLDFDLDTYSNDLLLLKLMDPVPLDMFPPVNLNMDRFSFGQEFRVLGLGSTYEGGPYAEVLQEVIVKQVNTTDCAGAYAREGFDIVNSTIMFCAKGSGKDACQGDSGMFVVFFKNL
jgi:secreted trypsin-like serine protease